jgi:hypothetical protein
MLQQKFNTSQPCQLERLRSVPPSRTRAYPLDFSNAISDEDSSFFRCHETRERIAACTWGEVISAFCARRSALSGLSLSLVQFGERHLGDGGGAEIASFGDVEGNASDLCPLRFAVFAEGCNDHVNGCAEGVVFAPD